jgi:Family of unknown function (DUF5677)
MTPLDLGEHSYSSRVVDEHRLAQATDAQPFADEAVVVLRELLQSVTLVAGIERLNEDGQPRTLSRDEAVLAGLMVRCLKLHQGLLQFCTPPRMELFGFLLRGATETAVNLRYLLEHGTPELFEAFVRASLRLDKQLHDRIEARVADRGGTVMPMEHSMLAGIERAFKVAGVELDDVDAADHSAWSPRGAYGRFEATGLKELYGPYFGVQSNYVHGNWHELYDHHLTVQPDGGFLPDLSFEEELQPQPLLAAVDVLADAAVRYLQAAAPASVHRETLEDRIASCGERAQLITRAWERFRQSMSGLSHAPGS